MELDEFDCDEKCRRLAELPQEVKNEYLSHGCTYCKRQGIEADGVALSHLVNPGDPTLIVVVLCQSCHEKHDQARTS